MARQDGGGVSIDGSTTTAAVPQKDARVYLSESTSFSRFLSWTDEKTKIAEAVKACFKTCSRRGLMDIGAGDGSLTYQLRDQFDGIASIEPSPVLFEKLAQRMRGYAPQQLMNFDFETAASFLRSCGERECYSAILASYSLRYVKNQPAALAAIRDFLEPDGTFVLVDIAPDSQFWEFYLPHEMRIRRIATDPKTYDYGTLLRSVFGSVELIRFYSTLVIPSVDDAIGILDFIYDVKRESISDEDTRFVRDQWRQTYGDGSVTVRFDHIAYSCKK